MAARLVFDTIFCFMLMNGIKKIRVQGDFWGSLELMYKNSNNAVL